MSTLSQCVLPEPVVKFLESRKAQSKGGKRFLPDPATIRDDTFLTTLPENQLLFPRLFLGTRVFTASPAGTGERALDELTDVSDGQGLVRYIGPELRRNDAVLYGALAGMSRGFQPGIRLQVNAEWLLKVLRVDVAAQAESLRRLAAARVDAQGASFPLVEAFDLTNPRHWWFQLGAAQADFLRRTVITPIPIELVSEVRHGLACWLLLAAAGGRFEVPPKRIALQTMSGYAHSREAFSDALHAARRVLTELDTVEAHALLAQLRKLFR